MGGKARSELSVLRNFSAGALKVAAHLLLLLLVAVLGAPDAEIENVPTSLRNAFSTGLLQNPAIS